MLEERRKFIKSTLGASAVGVGMLISAKCSIAADKQKPGALSNGVVTGHSPKNEVLYKKTQNWEIYYKAAY